MKKIITVILLAMLLFTHVYGLEVTDYSGDQDNSDSLTQGETQTLLEIRGDVRRNSEKLAEMPTEAEIDSSFQQLDQKFTTILRDLPLTFIAFVVGILIFNDLLLIAFYIILKTRGLV